MSLIDRDQAVVWHPFTQRKTAGPPLPIVRGEGATLIDEQGNRYIDAIASWWVNIHGHSHPYIASRIAEQANTLEHVIFAGFTHPPAVELAEQLVQLLPSNQSRIFYSDNGSTAVEIMIKMAIQYFHNRGEKRSKLIAFDQAFHGETFGAMSASGDLSLNTPFKEHLFEVLRIPAPLPGREQASRQALREILETESVYGFIFEPLVMGAGGMLMYEPAILDELIAMCQEQGVLCLADEVMTGFGRTGKLFASLYLQHQPDLMAMAKGLTGGTLPLAVTACSERIFEAFVSEDKHKTFFHGHSFTANPLGCAAALASLELLEGSVCKENLQYICEAHATFAQKIKEHPSLRDVRQRGTILAMEFENQAQSGYFNSLRDRLYAFFLKRGLLLRPLGNVIYIMPPYCITAKELNRVYAAVEEALHVFRPDRATV